MFSVSRPTIREAVIALELESFVEVRMGSGVYIIENTKGQSRFSDKDIGPFELTEARALFEGEAAGLAATMISDEELSLLSSTLDEMACENINDIETHEAADKKFHMIIAKATNNSAICPILILEPSVLATPNRLSVHHRSGLAPPGTPSVPVCDPKSYPGRKPGGLHILKIIKIVLCLSWLFLLKLFYV